MLGCKNFEKQDQRSANGRSCPLSSFQILRNSFSRPRCVSVRKMCSAAQSGGFGVSLSSGLILTMLSQCCLTVDRAFNFLSRNHTPWVPQIMAQRTSLSPLKCRLQRPLQGIRLTTADSIAACQSYPIEVFRGLLVPKHSILGCLE